MRREGSIDTIHHPHRHPTRTSPPHGDGGVCGGRAGAAIRSQSGGRGFLALRDTPSPAITERSASRKVTSRPFSLLAQGSVPLLRRLVPAPPDRGATASSRLPGYEAITPAAALPQAAG